MPIVNCGGPPHSAPGPTQPPASRGAARRQRAAPRRVACQRAEEGVSGSVGAGAPASNGAAQTQADRSEAVLRALREARVAAIKVEQGLDGIHTLPSARLPKRTPILLRVFISLAKSGALLGLIVASQLFGPWGQLLGALGAGSYLAISGFRRGSLSRSGALAAVFVGAGTLLGSLRAGMVLYAFYLSSSKLTTFREERKEVDEAFRAGGQRDWVQVFCNGFVPTVLALGAGALTGWRDIPLGVAGAGGPYTLLMGGLLGYFGCCCGDTWASEVGQLSTAQPRLIISGRPVRKGTNGGVTALGLGASVSGGLTMGLVFYLAALASPTLWRRPELYGVAQGQFALIGLGLFAGLFGSILDSVLGATVQFTGYNRRTGRITSKLTPEVSHISGWPLLTNNGVNFVSASTSACVTALLACRLLP